MEEAIRLNNQQNHHQESIKRVALYARVSTVEQAEEGYSIDEQINILRDWCDREGHTIYKEYVDRGVSGKDIKGRPAIKQLLYDATQGEFDMVLVWKMNRLSRKSVDLLTIVDQLQKRNIGFRSYTEKYETETPSGVLQFQMMAAIAEFERANIAENVKMGMIARAKEGLWNGGQVLGYNVIKEPSDNRKGEVSKLYINDEEAITIRKIFDMYVNGHGYKAISNHLNKQGFKTKKNNHFSINAIKTILSNPVYAGYIRYNVRRDWSEKRRNNINPDPIIVPGQHEPIITQETWEQAQINMKKRSRRPNRIHDGEFPLTGILRCPVCNSGMVVSRTINRNKDGTKRKLEYYACGAWKNKGTAVCRSNTVRTDYADKYVLEKLTKLADNDILIKQIVDNINDKNQANTAPLQHEFESLKQSLSSLQHKKEKYLQLYVEEIISKGDLSKQLVEIEQKEVHLKERLQPIEGQLTYDGTPQIDYQTVKRVMKDFVGAYKGALTREQRKSLLHLLIHKITISEDRKIETIQIQMNNEVTRYFKAKEGASSSIDDESAPSFHVLLDL
ncbi:MAG TPA: recombinase family protein [Virgibacillus sp.]|nr:recombinase family protein [Virgibacillus sp.]HLR65534.1 recombinase family protein [Virgibacillus sp.]